MTKRYFSLSVLAGLVSMLAFVLSGAVFVEAQLSPPTCSLNAIPQSIQAGGFSTLTWASTGATSLMFDQGIGTSTYVAAGSYTVQPSTTPITYTATFTGPGGTASCSTTIGTGSASVLPTTPPILILPPPTSVV